VSTALEAGGVQRLAYELSRDALARQELALDELRARTGTLLAASSVVASFLGSRAADSGSGTLTVLALGAFVVSIAASLYILLPNPGLIFALRGSVLFESEYDDPGGLSEAHRRLAYWLERYHDDNQTIVNRLFRSYRAASLGVAAQVLLWVFELVW
jgi:hypothetical protein